MVFEGPFHANPHYCKVAITNILFRTHPSIYRLLMKVKFQLKYSNRYSELKIVACIKDYSG